MLSIIGDALFTASRAKRHAPEPRDRWAGRFVTPAERRDDHRRFNTSRDLFW